MPFRERRLGSLQVSMTTVLSISVLIAISPIGTELRIGVWEYGIFETDREVQPPNIIKCSQITSQVGRITVRKEKDLDELTWISIGLDQVCRSSCSVHLCVY